MTTGIPDANTVEPMPAPTPEELFAKAVSDRKDWLKITAEAKRQFDDEENPPPTLPDGKSLADLLAAPRTETPFLIDDLAPAGGRVLLAAPGKAGKTTLIQNLIRSLADGDPFLGRFNVAKPCRQIALIDTEMTSDQLTNWSCDQNINNTTAVKIWTLRGSVGTFDLSTSGAVPAGWTSSTEPTT